jgi:hypothetical protein
MKKQITVLTAILVLAMLIVPASLVVAQPAAYDSCFQVQNLSSTDADIVVYYYEQGNTTAVAMPSDTVTGDGSTTYCPLSAVTDGFNGSVVIESTEEIAAITNVTGGSWGAYNASYAGFDAGATTVNLPLLFKDNYGYNTWFNVQNAGASAASVTIAYSDGTSDSATIQPNLAQTFDQATETHSQAVFAASITSDQPIVVTVMEVGPSGQPMLFGYNGFIAGDTNPVMPLVQANNFGYTSGIQVQNTGGSSTDVTVQFTPSDAGTACTQTQTVAAGASETFGLLAWDAGDANSDNNCVNGETFVGSAEVTGNTASQDLVAIVNQHDFAGNMGASYGSFSPANATGKVVMPLIMQDNYGYFTGFNVMNVGTAATDVTCTFSGSSYTEGPKTLNPGEAMTAVQYGTALGAGYVGSAVCTATAGGELVGVVNETLLGSGQDTFLVYEAFNSTP